MKLLLSRDDPEPIGIGSVVASWSVGFQRSNPILPLADTTFARVHARGRIGGLKWTFNFRSRRRTVGPPGYSEDRQRKKT